MKKLKKKSSVKKEMFSTFTDTDKNKNGRQKDFVTSSEVEKPNLQSVKDYFQSQQSNDFEVERFFNYYSSIGWLIAGKTIMKDWQASARNWMLNTTKFTINHPAHSQQTEKSQNRTYNLIATTDKKLC